MKRLCWIVLAACGSPGPKAPRPRVADEPRLEPKVAEQTWYRAQSICGQGPFEVELPTVGATWGEEVELLVHAPHKIVVHAEVLADDKPVESRTFGDRPDNARCIADAKERLALAHAGSSGGGHTVEVQTGTLVGPPPAAPDGRGAPPALSIVTQNVTTSDELVRFRLPEHATPHIKIRFWSVEPNDLEGVLFGAAHIVWQPNVPEAEYEAHLRAVAEREAAEQQREAAEQQRRADEYARTHPARQVDPAQLRAEEDQRRRDDEARRRDDEARRRREREDERRRQIAAALEVQRREQRARYCAAHADDRDCWGAGGLRVHLDLERHRQEADEYCQAHHEDARCWSSDEWTKHRTAWQGRLAAVEAASSCQPTGAPPAAQAESQPPALSPHATWRPGYWQWTECTWLWLAGQWRVPDSDLVAETTTIAPAAPPPLQTEAPPPPPVRTAVWLPGFWQWNAAAASWVWIAGSWQLRPSAADEWRPAEWRVRGDVHVLVPGGWIHVR